MDKTQFWKVFSVFEKWTKINVQNRKPENSFKKGGLNEDFRP